MNIDLGSGGTSLEGTLNKSMSSSNSSFTVKKVSFSWTLPRVRHCLTQVRESAGLSLPLNNSQAGPPLSYSLLRVSLNLESQPSKTILHTIVSLTFFPQSGNDEGQLA